MPNIRETEMGRNVQRSRKALQALLTPDEWKTKRCVGSAYPRTCEDSARMIADSDDPRAFAVKIALDDFQSDVNVFWEYTIERRMPLRHVRDWINSSKPSITSVPGTYEDAVSEATMLMRAAIIVFNPAKGNIWMYSWRGVMRGLQIWYHRLYAPVEVPEKIARDLEISVDRASLEEHNDYKEDLHVE